MMTPETFDVEGFQGLCETLTNAPHPSIVIAQVDPDAVASAFALRFILQKKIGESIPIFYAGSVAHPQNRSILNKYNLLASMQEITHMKDDLPYSVVLVDSNRKSDSRASRLANCDIVGVFDHHRDSDIDKDSCFMWMDDVGSCSTLIAELAHTVLDGGIVLPDNLRVLLSLGIYTDTKALVSGSYRDREAYAWLTRNIDPSEVAQFVEYPLPESHFNHLREALSQMSRKNDKIIASCGVMSDADGDDLSTIADYLIRMTGVTLVVVWAIIGSKVRVSARNRDLTTPLDQFLKERLGSRSGAKLAPDGRGEGGAILDLDLGFWYSEETKAHVLAMVKTKFESMIFSPPKQ